MTFFAIATLADFFGEEIKEATVYYIAEEPTTEITPSNIDCFKTVEEKIIGNTLTLPRAAVAAIEITLK